MEVKLLQLLEDCKSIRAFIGANKKFHIQMLVECRVSLINEELVIVCPNADVAHALFLRHLHLSRVAIHVGANRITLIAGNEYFRSFPATKQSASTIMQQIETNQKILGIQEHDLYQELCGFPGGAKAIRFFDDVGIANNDRVEASSGVRPNDWPRMRNQDFWIQEELTAYKRRLMQDLDIRNYEYVAFLATGQKCQFNVDARLVIFRGDLTRIVKVNTCIPV